MFARKDKSISDDNNYKKTNSLERMKSKEIIKEGYCHQIHLEELPGFIELEVAFSPDMNLLDNPFKVSLPVCKIVPLIPQKRSKLQ